MLKKMENGKKAHVYVTLQGKDKGIKVKTLIDTGNTIREESAITTELHEKLKVGFLEKGGSPIGTAKKDGPKLIKRGVSNPITMKIDGIKGCFEIRPAVVDTLSDSLNLGSGFLCEVGKEVPVHMEFTQGEAVLRIGQKAILFKSAYVLG